MSRQRQRAQKYTKTTRDKLPLETAEFLISRKTFVSMFGEIFERLRPLFHFDSNSNYCIVSDV